MTVTAKNMRKVISGVGWSNPLTHNVYLENAAHLTVYSVIDGVATELTLGDDYTVDDLLTEAGYEVTIDTFPPGDEPDWYFADEWVLNVEPPLTQSANLSLGGSFGAAYEAASDDIMRRIQAVADMAKRAFKSPLNIDPNTLDQADLVIDPDVIPDLTEAAAAAVAAANAAEASAAAALASENAADADADQTALDRVAVAADKATVAADKATVAADKATVANDKATVAADKAVVAADKATVAADKATVATDTTTTTTAKDAAVAAQVAAEAALASTLSAFDSFDDRYLGPKAADPTLDNDGNALVAGALYFNTVSAAMMVYTGSVWAAAYVDGATVLLKAQNLNDLPNKVTARTNLSVYSVAEIDAYAANAASKATPIDADSVAIVDSAASNVQKRVTFANFWTWIVSKLNGTSKSTPVAADRVYIGDSAASNAPKYSTFTEIMTLFGALINGSTAKTSPVAADIIAIADSAASNATKKVTFTNLISQWGVFLTALTGKTTPVGADELLISDSAASSVSKKVSLTNFMAAIFASPALTGTPTAPTAAPATNTTQIATTAFVLANAGAVSTTFGDVGTYVFGYARTTGLTDGSTLAGSSIEPAGIFGSGAAPSDDGEATASFGFTKGGSALSGTWRIMGRVNDTSASTYSRLTLFVRIV